MGLLLNRSGVCLSFLDGALLKGTLANPQDARENARCARSKAQGLIEAYLGSIHRNRLLHTGLVNLGSKEQVERKADKFYELWFDQECLSLINA